jgi:hypothetical protein
MNKTIGIDKDITILDKVNFILTTTNDQDCPILDNEGNASNPYKISNITIYFISRDFTSNAVNQYEKTFVDEYLLKEFEKAKTNACDSPTQENINKLNNIKIKIENSKSTSPFYFKEATPVKIFGSDDYPAWLNPDSVDPEEASSVEQNNILKPYVENGEEVKGKFVLEWDAYGNREGDYFICWHWKPSVLADGLSSHIMFSLLGESKSNTTIPTHFTKPNKYEILMERYLPDMFKNMMSENDLSPQVLQELNLSIAKGFTFIEDMANQIIDLFDSNVIQEQFLSLLSNLFDLQLKSNDSVLWRRQIKRAIPNFKKKGTKIGLERALSDAGMELKKLTNLWQVISKYTYQEMFKNNIDSRFDKIRNSFYFKLKYSPLLFAGIPDPQNVEVYYRSASSNSWQKLEYEYTEGGGWPVEFGTVPSDVGTEEVPVVYWKGDANYVSESQRLNLEVGDSFRVIYQIVEVPNLQEQNLENYTRKLDLMDQRDGIYSSYYDYKIDTSSTKNSQISYGYLRYNNEIQSNATYLYIGNSSISGLGTVSSFSSLKNGDVITIQDPNDSTHYQKFSIDGLVNLEVGGYIKAPVYFITSSGVDFIGNQDVVVYLDKRDQIFPPKNWNVRVIEQDDPLFDVIIPNRMPIQNPLVWGTIRTEFPYSENIYNMEEYNGSIRDSLNPCDIDKYFIDPCSDSPASKISLDLEVEELSDDRIIESQKIIEDYVPIHALIHNINFIGALNDLLKPPIEQITALLHGSSEEILIAGEAQNIFNRSLNQVINPENLENPILQDPDKPDVYYPLSRVRRDLLSSMIMKVDNIVGTALNNKIILSAPSFNAAIDLENSDNLGKSSSFNNININTSLVNNSALNNSNLLEILSSSNSGLYSVKNVAKNSFEIVGSISEAPLDKSQFEFRISNKLYEQGSVRISANYEFIFSSELDVSNFQIISQEDIDNNFETGLCWKIKINKSGYGSYDILRILPDNKFILKGPMPSVIGFSDTGWELRKPNATDAEISGEKGSLFVDKKALVDLSSGLPSGIDDIRNYIKIGDYLFYNGNQYKIKSFIEGENFKFYIQNYNVGNVGGVEISIYRRIIENCIGQLEYQGLTLSTSVNYEDLFKIQNGANFIGIKTKTSNLKENYLILINSEYYSILDIDGTAITLDGPYNEWKTSGTSINFTIYQFINQALILEKSLYPDLPSHNFDQIVRSNNEIIDNNIKTATPIMPTIIRKILNSKQSDSEIIELSKQSESIKIKIEYDNGNIEEKQL